MRVEQAGRTVERWRWRWRFGWRRARRDLVEQRIYTNPRVGYALVAGLWLTGLLLGLLKGAGGVLTQLATGLVITALLSLVAGFVLYLGSNRRLARRLRANARKAPEELLQLEPQPTLKPGPGARAGLYEDIANALAELPPVGAQLIVGETGSGKTSVLVELAGYLADRGMVPVIVSLRGSPSLDFLGLAHEALVAQLGSQVAAPDEAERVWRWLRRSGRLVVLADDLDEASLLASGQAPDSYPIRRALEVVRRDETPLVVTTRPAGVPETLAGSAITLDPLDPEEAVRQVSAGAGRGEQDEATRQRLSQLVTAGRLGEVPFYLEAATALTRSDELPAVADDDPNAVRMSLLQAYERALSLERLVTEANVGPGERRRAIDAFSVVAARELATASANMPLAQVIGHIRRAAPDRDPLRIVDAAERLRIVVRRDPGKLRFRHQIVQSYLASRLLVDDWAGLRGLSMRARTPKALNALLMAAIRSRPDVRRHVGDSLLAAARGRNDEWGLVLVTTAADIARIASDPGLEARTASAAMRCAPADEPHARTPDVSASPHTKRAMISRLARLRGDGVSLALWHFTNDPDWVVKWDAAEALCANAAGAYTALTQRFDRYLADAVRQVIESPGPSTIDDWQDRGPFQLKMLAWLLPSLATALYRNGDEDAAANTDRQWRAMRDLQLTPITCQLGLEAAMSQGLKADATRMRESADAPPIDRLTVARRRALDMLGTAEFWFTRIQLVHTLALIEGAAADPDETTRQRLERIAAGDPGPQPDTRPTDACFDAPRPPFQREHAFTSEAARIAIGALSNADWRARIWNDEGVVVSRRVTLSDEASRLVGDIAVLLNLNEQGDAAQRLEFGYRTDLPACISRSSDRAEILGAGRSCPDDCPFSLCPYHRADTEAAHRELSRAFCRHQGFVAERSAKPDWSPIEKRALRDFWRAMERRARV